MSLEELRRGRIHTCALSSWNRSSLAVKLLFSQTFIKESITPKSHLTRPMIWRRKRKSWTTSTKICAAANTWSSGDSSYLPPGEEDTTEASADRSILIRWD